MFGWEREREREGKRRTNVYAYKERESEECFSMMSLRMTSIQTYLCKNKNHLVKDLSSFNGDNNNGDYDKDFYDWDVEQFVLM